MFFLSRRKLLRCTLEIIQIEPSNVLQNLNRIVRPAQNSFACFNVLRLNESVTARKSLRKVSSLRIDSLQIQEQIGKNFLILRKKAPFCHKNFGYHSRFAGNSGSYNASLCTGSNDRHLFQNKFSLQTCGTSFSFNVFWQTKWTSSRMNPCRLPSSCWIRKKNTRRA